MTWGIKVRLVIFALAIIAALALASGASWIEGDPFDSFGLGL
jgi:Tfp pilus assembly protein FimT